MINPYELMLGNWLKNADGRQDQVILMAPAVGDTVTPGNERSFKFVMRINGCTCEEWFPIPITPEWLEMLGMHEKQSNENYSRYVGPHDFAVSIRKTPDKVIPAGTILADSFLVIEYVHELQNLYRITFKKALGV